MSRRSIPNLLNTALAEEFWPRCMGTNRSGRPALFQELTIAPAEKDSMSGGTEARAGRYRGSILVTDQLRPSAAPAVKALAHMKIKVALLTGDAKAAAEAVADQFGIIQVYSELLPE